MTDRSNHGLTRRSFLKGAGMTAGAVGVVGATGMTSADGWLKPADASETLDERTACTYHQSHCGSMCSLKCTVRDGRLALIQPNDKMAEKRYQTICLKGISEIQHVYGAGRIQTPLKRVGERGENDFMQTTWEEALDDIVARIKDIQEAHGKDAVMVTNGAEADVGFLAPLLGACGQGFNAGIDTGTGNGLDPALGMGWGYAMTNPEARDWVDSRLVIHTGTNFCESSLTTSRLLFEAKEAGARIVTIDPHYSTTACKSDEWIPIEPGTDPALFLGMVSHILDKKLYDEDFMRQHTSLPFLVDEETRMLVKAKDPETDPLTAVVVPGQKDIYYVIDKGSAVLQGEASDIALSGTVEVEGCKARTVFDLLVEGQKEYTTRWASEVTGIPQATIERLAEEYAQGPSSLCVGWGGWDKISNADVGGHAVAVLVALTGNIGKKGTGVGVYVGGSYSGHASVLGAWALPADMMPGASPVALYDMPTKENNVHAWIAVGDSYIQRMANCTAAEDWVRSLDLIVSADPYFTESCKWADYVLPLTTRFEYDEDFGNITNGYSHIVMQQKVIDPLFEAKTDLWFVRELAKRLELDSVLPATARERADAILSTSPDEYVNALTVEKLAENQCVWPAKDIAEVRRVVPDYAFATASGNIDLYYDSLVKHGQALPAWEPPLEARRDNPDRVEMPFQLGGMRTRFRIHNQFNDAEWLQQLYVPTVDVNPSDLEGSGIRNGDVVEVANDRGSFKVPVHLNEAIRPGSARIYEGATADYTVEGNLQSVTNNTRLDRGYDMMMGPVAPYSDTIVSIKKA
ncbi:molybdopterin-dependent oxidoreductase [Slackia exigua]|nr:molybdopterin-dependent oxidoreductase [Slackia exigua]STN98485.1 Dimethyl sulfoxide reductase DmsA precursor [Slackia exigua]